MVFAGCIALSVERVFICVLKPLYWQFFHKKCNILEAKENSCYITFSAKTGHLTACVTISKAERCYTNMEINVAKLNELPEGSYQLIDMRSDRDFEYGTIPGAIHILQEDLKENPQIIKAKKVILFCSHGTNSIEAAEELEADGYRAYSLEGGYIAWLREEMRRQEAEDIKNQVEQSIRKKFRKTIWSPFTKAVKQYELVKEGDKVAVCISGGKDSMLLAKCMQELKKHRQVNFDLVFLVMDPGYNPINRQKIINNAKLLNIPITMFESNIFEVVEKIDDHPCYVCARMRRGYLYKKAQELGCNKIALGHHFDDVIETILMGMLYGAQMQTMMPKLHSTYHEGMELIRPLYYVKEADIIRWRERNDLHFIQCACKFTEHCTMCDNGGGGSKREEMKKLIKQLRSVYDKVDMNIYNSTKNVNLNTLISYIEDGEVHHFMDKY